MKGDKVTPRLSRPLGFLLQAAGVCGLACLAGGAVLRLGLSGPVAADSLSGSLETLTPWLVSSLLLAFLSGALAVSALAIFTSHKIAGPLFRLQQVADGLRRLVLVERVHLRAGDEAKPVAAEINAWVSRCRGEWTAFQARAREVEEAVGRWESAQARSAAEEERMARAEVENLVQEFTKFVASKS